MVGSGADEDGEQAISLWEWTVDRDGPLYTSPVEVGNIQTCIRFNHDDIREVVTNGTQRVVFWSWHAKKFKFYSPPISQRDFRQTIGDFTMSVFLHGTTQAVSATADGDVLLWDQDSVRCCRLGAHTARCNGPRLTRPCRVAADV